jgi:hypothetical protein
VNVNVSSMGLKSHRRLWKAAVFCHPS